MTTEEFLLLYEKYLSGECTPEEEKILFSEKAEQLRLYESIKGKETKDELIIRDKVYKQIVYAIKIKRRRIVRMGLLYVAAACIVAAMIMIPGLFSRNKQLIMGQPEKVASLPKKDSAFKMDPVPKVASVSKISKIRPGSNSAILTLSDGSRIELDKLATGLIALQGKTGIKKLTGGRIVYEPGTTDESPATPLLNTIATPRGGQYNLKLADGTLVWLNSESVISFPASFTGEQRVITLKGEAYFEVAKDATRPFKVEAGTVNVEVLGTHFNVRAFPGDRGVYTTLLEGAVKVDNGRQSKLLSPGEQSILPVIDDTISVRRVRVDEAVAWKNGLFVFRESTVKEIMEQFARWYNVEVEYHGDVEYRTFGGVYSKNKDLGEILTSMELTGLVRFEAKGRRIIVMP